MIIFIIYDHFHQFGHFDKKIINFCSFVILLTLFDYSDHFDHSDHSGLTDHFDQTDHSDRSEHFDHFGHFDHSDLLIKLIVWSI